MEKWFSQNKAALLFITFVKRNYNKYENFIYITGIIGNQGENNCCKIKSF